ncbi:MAG: ComEC/Rec2 family competence protein [Clostridia bacterium]|nr:ComEC/Rec2 family competence protein [Clostridia bacterium]
MEKRPFFIVGASAFAGAFAAFLLPTGALIALGILLILAVVLLCLTSLPKVTKRLTAIAAAAAILLGAGFSLKLVLAVDPLVERDGETLTLTVQVMENGSSQNAYIVRVEEGDLPGGTRLCMWLTGQRVSPDVGTHLTGEWQLSAAVETSELTDHAYTLSHGTYLYARPVAGTHVKQTDGTLPFPGNLLQALRSTIHAVLRDALDPITAPIAQSMMLGDRSSLPSKTIDAFRSSGVYHLLVVSGLHLAIVMSAMLWLLRRLRLDRRLQTVMLMVGVIFFMLLCGLSPSVMRAGIMALLALFAELFRRQADGLNSLGAAALLMLLINPFSACDIGMQLSFAATAGLLLFLPIWEKRVTARVLPHHPFGAGVRPFVSAIGVSLAATAATSPLLALYFERLSLVFLPMNLLCVWPASIMLILCFAAVPLAAIWAGNPISAVLFWFVQGFGGWMAGWAGLLADLPFSTLTIDKPYAVVWLAAAVCVLPLSYHWFRRKGLVCTTVVMMLTLSVAVTLSTLGTLGVTTVTVPDTAAPALLLQRDGKAAIVMDNDFNAARQLAKQLQSEDVDHLTWVLCLNNPDEPLAVAELGDVTVETLALKAAAEQPPEQAKQFVVLEDETALSDREQATAYGDFVRLVVGNTSVLIAGTEADAVDLPEELRQTDVLCYQKRLPLHSTLLQAKLTIDFSQPSYAPSADTPPPCGASEQIVSGDVDRVFRTRGTGDLSRPLW